MVRLCPTERSTCVRTTALGGSDEAAKRGVPESGFSTGSASVEISSLSGGGFRSARCAGERKVPPSSARPRRSPPAADRRSAGGRKPGWQATGAWRSPPTCPRATLQIDEDGYYGET